MSTLYHFLKTDFKSVDIRQKYIVLPLSLNTRFIMFMQDNLVDHYCRVIKLRGSQQTYVDGVKYKGWQQLTKRSAIAKCISIAWILVPVFRLRFRMMESTVMFPMAEMTISMLYVTMVTTCPSLNIMSSVMPVTLGDELLVQFTLALEGQFIEGGGPAGLITAFKTLAIATAVFL